MCIFRVFPLSPFHPFRCPLFLSLSNVLCPLSHFFVLCLPSYVPCLMSLFLIFRPLSPVSQLCSLSPVFCTLSHVICFLSPILLSPTPNPYQLSQCPLFCGSIPLFLSLLLCFQSSFPPSLVLCPLSFTVARMRVYFDGWLRAGIALECKASG
jgi:hypothetical protein